MTSELSARPPVEVGDSDAFDHLLVIALLDTLELEPAGEHSWRVCNRRIPHGEGRFMAFVEESNGQFEVTQVIEDFAVTVCPTLWDALTHVLLTHNVSGTARITSESTEQR